MDQSVTTLKKGSIGSVLEWLRPTQSQSCEVITRKSPPQFNQSGTPVKGKQGPNVLDAQTLTSPHSPPTGGQSLHLDTGNTAFMLLCASLVMLMTPGWHFFTAAGGTKERARHHDAKFRLDGLDYGLVVGLRILNLFLRRSKERHRFLELSAILTGSVSADYAIRLT
jgi:hypothetical protein